MKIKHINIFLISIFLFIFTGCADKIPLPYNTSEKIKILEPINGYYENKIGKRHVLTISEYDYKTKHSLLIWPDKNYKAICLKNKICLVDTLNNGYFSHSSVIGRKTLYPLNKPSRYIKNIQDLIYNDEREKGVKVIYFPELNSIVTKEVGQSIYKKAKQFNFGTFKTMFNQEIDGWSFNGNYDLLEWPENKYKAICNTDDICLLDFNNSGSFTHYSINYNPNFLPLKKDIKYTLIQNVEYKENSFKYEALYQGRIGDIIKISFREFKDDMARPAFTQDIEYQLESNKPTIIGFKGLRIKVIKATNLDITYSVIKDYN